MDNKALKVLLKILRENGVLHYKTQELELQIAPEGMLLPQPEYKDDPPELTPEQLMYGAVMGDLDENIQG